MMRVRARPLVVLAGATALASCQAREEARSTPPPAPAAVATTTTTTTTTMPAPPPVWRGARWDMAEDELLAAFAGEARRLDKPASFGQPRPGTANLGIPVYEIEGTPFRVLFGFGAAGLNRIQLAAPKAEYGACEDLEKRLTEENGQPSSKGETVTSMVTKESVWSSPRQTITLTCAEKPALGFRSVTLDYAAPGSAPTN
jgi:hypothetical protein